MTDFNETTPIKDIEANATTLHAKASEAKQAIKDGTAKLSSQATDKARFYADEGKAKAGGLLDQFSQMLTEAAGTVDDKLGAQYGQYARSAASSVSSLSDTIKAKDIEELIDDTRDFVRKSPAVAIGIAAAVGFVVARLVQSGTDTGRN